MSNSRIPVETSIPGALTSTRPKECDRRSPNFTKLSNFYVFCLTRLSQYLVRGRPSLFHFKDEETEIHRD